MKTIGCTLVALATVLLTSTTTLADNPPVRGPMRPSIGRGIPGRDAAKTAFAAWNEAELVFTGKLERVDAGPVGRSYPPMYTHTLHFTVEQVLRGDLKPGEKIVVSHVARQHQVPTFPKGELCLVAASKARGGMRALAVEKAAGDKVKAVELACALPLGWKMVDGKPVSPWASLGEKAWPDGVDIPSALVCSKTGRPALLTGPGIDVTVEKVPPTEEIKWTNPDGDGEYTITVTNTTDKPVDVMSLLTDGETVLWEQCVVILCQGRPYTWPGAKGITGQVKPVRLKAGESVSATVNALRLKGPKWPRGGYRIEFQFCLGEKSRTKSFYYMSRHHDKIREKSTTTSSDER